MVPFDTIFVPLSAALGLSLTVERILELGKNLLERVIGKKRGRTIPSDAEYEQALKKLEQAYIRDRIGREVEKKLKQSQKQHQKLIQEINKERSRKTPDLEKIKGIRAKLKELEQDGEWDEEVPASTVLVEPATDPDEGDKMKVFILQALGLAIGIVAAHYSGIRLFSSFLTALGQPELPPSVDFILTGLLIGGGSGPMHVLVKFITQHKITTTEVESSEEEEAQAKLAAIKKAELVTAMPISPSKEQWIDIPYSGGVDRSLLEGVHLREKNPELIIFHHTGMHNKTRFEDVVRVIKDKTDSAGNHWLTGYNCVVSAEGKIHPFCRWDRYGNHTAGCNMQSLGIALNGNFETDPRVPGANSDERFGATRPGELQLKNAARVITLWCFLYDIEPDFKRKIMPHSAFSSKSCPGSVFPYAEFKRWIDYFYKTWRQSDYVREQIEIYKLKPFLYVEQGKEA